MAGIYIHVPFCKNKCHYCNFFSIASNKYIPNYVDALCKEIEQKKSYLFPDNPQTIYLGGGTPSILSVKDLERIFSCLDKNFNLVNVKEITLEANPEDLSDDTLKLYQKYLPVNRLSIGIQSLFDEDLQYLNRIQKVDSIKKIIENAQNAGFTNLSVDFIYAIPTLTTEKLQKNLEFAIDLKIPHISCYSLSIEEKTPLCIKINKGQLPAPNEGQSIEQFKFIHSFLEQHGYLHYEISNYALAGKEALHNSNYWKANKYLGLGPGAHSYDGKINRSWNIANISQYIQALNNNSIFFEQETLSPNDLYNEYIMLSLRTSSGIEWKYFNKFFSEAQYNYLLSKVKPFIDKGLLILTDKNLYPTLNGMLVVDAMAVDLFIDNK